MSEIIFNPCMKTLEVIVTNQALRPYSTCCLSTLGGSNAAKIVKLIIFHQTKLPSDLFGKDLGIPNYHSREVNIS